MEKNTRRLRNRARAFLTAHDLTILGSDLRLPPSRYFGSRSLHKYLVGPRRHRDVSPLARGSHYSTSHGARLRPDPNYCPKNAYYDATDSEGRGGRKALSDVVEAEPERRAPVAGGRGCAGGGGAGVLRRRGAQAPRQALPQRALRGVRRRDRSGQLPPGARQVPRPRSPHRETGVRGRQGRGGVRGDGVLQGSRWRRKAAPHDRNRLHQDGQRQGRLVHTVRKPQRSGAPCFLQGEPCYQRVDPVG